METLRAGDHVVSPWKNGGGTTAEIAVFPPGASMDDFSWRVSMAEVREPGPFSVFSGIDRILTVLSGRLALDFADGSVELDAGSAPLAFSGAAPVVGRPLGGPVRDLNVMVRCGLFQACVEPRNSGGAVDAGKASVVVVARHALLVEAEGETLRLGAGDAFLLAPGENALCSGGACLVIRFEQPA